MSCVLFKLYCILCTVLLCNVYSAPQSIMCTLHCPQCVLTSTEWTLLSNLDFQRPCTFFSELEVRWTECVLQMWRLPITITLQEQIRKNSVHLLLYPRQITPSRLYPHHFTVPSDFCSRRIPWKLPWWFPEEFLCCCVSALTEVDNSVKLARHICCLPSCFWNSILLFGSSLSYLGLCSKHPINVSHPINCGYFTPALRANLTKYSLHHHTKANYPAQGVRRQEKTVGHKSSIYCRSPGWSRSSPSWTSVRRSPPRRSPCRSDPRPWTPAPDQAQESHFILHHISLFTFFSCLFPSRCPYHDDILVAGLGGLLGGRHLVALQSDSRLALTAVGRVLVKRLTDPEGTGLAYMQPSSSSVFYNLLSSLPG